MNLLFPDPPDPDDESLACPCGFSGPYLDWDNAGACLPRGDSQVGGGACYGTPETEYEGAESDLLCPGCGQVYKGER